MEPTCHYSPLPKLGLQGSADPSPRPAFHTEAIPLSLGRANRHYLASHAVYHPALNYPPSAARLIPEHLSGRTVQQVRAAEPAHTLLVPHRSRGGPSGGQ